MGLFKVGVHGLQSSSLFKFYQNWQDWDTWSTAHHKVPSISK